MLRLIMIGLEYAARNGKISQYHPNKSMMPTGEKKKCTVPIGKNKWMDGLDSQ